MEDYSFHEGHLPSGYTIGFEQSLFNRTEHLSLQTAKDHCSFYLIQASQKKAIAAIHFFIDDGIAASPLRAPFGSVESDIGLAPLLIFQFLEFVEKKLKEKSVLKIIIKCPPQIYSDRESLLHTFLLNLNYHVTQAEIGAVIDVKKNNLADMLHRSEKKRLRKADNADLQFQEVPIDRLEEIYSFIDKCRATKNFKLSLSLAELQRAVDRFRNDYLLFGVFHEQKLAAASIAIRVKENILYEFYHDHDSAFDHLSPVVLLVDGIYDYCYRNSISLFDLGTSAIDGKPNFSLLTFKLHLGAKPTSKFTFEKLLR